MWRRQIVFTFRGSQADCRKVEVGGILLLERRSDVVAGHRPGLKIPPAVEAADVVGAAGPVVDRSLRVRAERTGASGLDLIDSGQCRQQVRRNALLDPIRERDKGVIRRGTGSGGEEL